MKDVRVGPVMPYEVWWERLEKATRPSWVPEPVSDADQAERVRRETITEETVVAMARGGAHGREIRDYLIDSAPLRTDPAHYIQSLVDRKLIVRGSLDPYANQYAGGNYGNPICHPTHYRYWAP